MTAKPLRLLVITGATATGKTRLAVKVAHTLSSEIISADSRQVYRELDLGTGKDLEEYKEVTPPVPYHLIDIVEPDSVYTLYHFQRDCYRVLIEKYDLEPFQSGTPLVMAGGTPLYVASVLLDYRIPRVPPNEELRRSLEARALPDLVDELRRSDNQIVERTDTSSKRRVIRALEVAAHARRNTLQTTEPLPFPLEAEVFALRVDRGEIRRRIDERLETRLEAGLVDEVQGLIDRGLGRDRLDQLGLEYREVAAFIHGDKSFDAMVHDLKVAIHRFSRRQEIWFRGFERRGIPVTWIAPDDAHTILERVSTD